MPLRLHLLSILQKCQTLKQLYQIQTLFITSGFFFPFPSPDAFCINNFIKAYSTSSHPQQALPFYTQMLGNGFAPNSFTFPPLLTCCSKLLTKSEGEECHAQTIKFGVDTVVPVRNSLIHLYGSFGLIHSATHLFDTMSHPDLISWNSIIRAYVKAGYLNDARRVFDEMPVRKNIITWNIMISGYLKGGNPGCSLKLFREMVKVLGFGVTTDTTIVTILTACGRSARLNEGRSVHGTFLKNRFYQKSSLILDTALIDMYSKCQRVETARIVFDRMSVEKSLVCWNAMVLGHCIHGSPQDGISLFTTMLGTTKTDSKGRQLVLLPDEVTFVGILCACARAGLLLEGKNYFYQMSSIYTIKPTFAHYWCMANLYYGVGLVHEAEQVLRSMPAEDEVNAFSPEALLLSSLLGSCRFRGDSDLGEMIALRLIELEPYNASRYNLLLNVYAVAGCWEEVGKVKELMKERGLRKTPGCSLLDLNEVVHDFAVGETSPSRMEEVYTTMDALAQGLKFHH